MGLSWVVLGLFWAHLSHLAGIYCLLEAIMANLAEKLKSFETFSIFGAQHWPRISQIPFHFWVQFGMASGSISGPIQDPTIQPDSLTKLGSKWDHFRTFIGSPPQEAKGHQIIQKHYKKTTFSVRSLDRKSPPRWPKRDPKTEPRINKNMVPKSFFAVRFSVDFWLCFY